MSATAVSTLDNASLRDSVGEAEWETRVNLAALFRVAHHMGWNDTVRNHGLLTVGRTIGEAFSFMRRLIAACETQVGLMSTGGLGWAMYLRLAESLDPSFED